MKKRKVAIVHYWLNGMRGGEKVIENLIDLFPQADIYTHVYVPEKCSEKINKQKVSTTFISKLPKPEKYYQIYLPLMPMALESIDLTEYDIIISSESGPAKGVILKPEAIHICYCHSPMRYLYDMQHTYFKGAGKIKKILMGLIFHYIRIWDSTSANRVDKFIANSTYVQKRIKRTYGKESYVIHPPVDINKFRLSKKEGTSYLMFGQLVEYKNPMLAVDAFIKNGKDLVIVGEGELLEDIKKITYGHDNIKVLGRCTDEKIEEIFENTKALIFPGVEDFGIVPLEAMASGKPVIAYKKGGALDTVIDKETGILFEKDTVEDLNDAIERFEGMKFCKEKLRLHAEKFSEDNFKENVKNYIKRCIIDEY